MSLPIPEYPWNHMLFRGIFLFLLGVAVLGVGAALTVKLTGWKCWLAAGVAVLGASMAIRALFIFAETR